MIATVINVCQCCNLFIPFTAKVMLCPLCFQNLTSDTSRTKVRCSIHRHQVVTARDN